MFCTSSTMRRFALEGVADEAGVGLAPVVVGDVVGGTDLAGQEAVPEWGVGDEADAVLAQQGQQLGLGVAGPQGVLGLQCGERVHGVGATDRVGRGLGQADVQDLALADQLGQCADGVLDGRAGVDPVLVVEVDPVGAQALEGALDGGADVGRAAVDGAGSATGMGHEAELGGDDDLVTAPADGAADDLLAAERAVDLGGVDVGHAEIECAVDGADGLGVVQAAARGVGAGHGHGTQADPGNLQAPECGVLQRRTPRVSVIRQ